MAWGQEAQEEAWRDEQLPASYRDECRSAHMSPNEGVLRQLGLLLQGVVELDLSRNYIGVAPMPLMLMLGGAASVC